MGKIKTELVGGMMNFKVSQWLRHPNLNELQPFIRL